MESTCAIEARCECSDFAGWRKPDKTRAAVAILSSDGTHFVAIAAQQRRAQLRFIANKVLALERQGTGSCISFVAAATSSRLAFFEKSFFFFFN